MGLTPYSLSGLLVALTCFILLIFTIRKSNTQLKKVWTLFNFAVIIWGFGPLFFGSVTKPSQALMWWKITYAGVIFIPVFFYHTAWSFSGQKDKRLLYFAYIQGLLFLVLLHTDYFFNGVELKFIDFYPYYCVNANILHHPFIGIWFFLIVHGHYKIFKEYHNAHGIKRLQSKYFFLGMLTGFVGGGANFLPIYDINIYPFGNFLIAVYPGIITYAIFRYRLLNLNIVLVRFMIFTVLFLMSITIPLLVFYNKTSILIGYYGSNVFLFIIIFCSSMISVIFSFVYLFVQNLAENKILKNHHQQQQTLLHLSRNMTLIKNFGELSDIIVNSFVDSAKIDYCSVYLFDNEKNYVLVKQKPHIVSSKIILPSTSPLIKKMLLSKDILISEELAIKGECIGLISIMEHLNASVISPAFIKDSLLGFIVIGNKLSGHPYSEDDLGIFATISNHAALDI